MMEDFLPQDIKLGMPSKGMTMRDYFAAKALPPIIDRLNGSGLLGDQTGYDFRRYAEIAYQLADAMIAARGDV